MPKYHVELAQTVIRECNLVVEADDENHAEKVALERWATDAPSDAFTFGDEPEVISIEVVADEEPTR